VLSSIALSCAGDHRRSRKPTSICAISPPKLTTVPVGVASPS
jgi:hypothetical protein